MSKPLYVPKNDVSIKWSTHQDCGRVVVNGRDLTSTVSGVSFSLDGDGRIPTVYLKVPVMGDLDVELDGVELCNQFVAADGASTCAACEAARMNELEVKARRASKCEGCGIASPNAVCSSCLARLRASGTTNNESGDDK